MFLLFNENDELNVVKFALYIILSLRGTSRGLTYTAYDYIGDIAIFCSSTLGCDVAICWKATLRKPRCTNKLLMQKWSGRRDSDPQFVVIS